MRRELLHEDTCLAITYNAVSAVHPRPNCIAIGPLSVTIIELDDLQFIRVGHNTAAATMHWLTLYAPFACIVTLIVAYSAPLTCPTIETDQFGRCNGTLSNNIIMETWCMATADQNRWRGFFYQMLVGLLGGLVGIYIIEVSGEAFARCVTAPATSS